jgi:hypothetical protein
MSRLSLLRTVRPLVGRVVPTVIILLVIQQGFGTGEEPQEKPANQSKKDLRADNGELFASHIRPLLEKYCFACHGPDMQTEGVRVDQETGGITVRKNRAMWGRVSKMLKFGSMPPEDEAQPSSSERATLVAWLDQTLTFLDCAKQDDPGRVTIRRLNRLEYHNTIRDLFSLDLDPTRKFPSDDVGEGFDNIGDVLSLPPLLFEKYMDAAEEVSRAVVIAAGGANTRTSRFPADKFALEGAARRSGETISMASQGTATTTVKAAIAGDYQLLVTAGAQQAGGEVAKLSVKVNGKPVEILEITASHRKMEEYLVKVTVPVGDHRVSLSFINDYYNPKDPDPANRDRNMFLRWVDWNGPMRVDPASLPESHQRIVSVRPGEGLSIEQAAARVLEPLMRRAFRGPVADQQVKRYAALVQLAMDQEETYERGLQVAISAILVSPRFLFRIEGGEGADDPTRVRLLDDFELASRLSFFLWSSIPDEHLLQLAQKGQLNRTSVLRGEIRRMLADPRSQSLVDGFATQWLNLRNLESASPNPDMFPFDDQLRSAMQRETELFFTAVMKDDRPVTDFLDGRYTFVNEQLAKHYGIEGVEGDEFRRVSLEGHPRAGVLTQASILTITSDPTRTSPVKRGKWIMENILGAPPPDPPAGVPEIEAAREALPNSSFREQLELHRSNAICASCHRHMDPLGFGFENYDAIGRWRDKDGEFPIDATGTLPGGEEFNGPIELIEILRRGEKEFVRSFTEKLLVFALGRGLRYYDQCAVEDMVKVLPSSEYRFSAVVEQIILSDPFRKRRGDGGRK